MFTRRYFLWLKTVCSLLPISLQEGFNETYRYMPAGMPYGVATHQDPAGKMWHFVAGK
jgi:hypothetical protein